jgi:DNA-binding Lrp family transcriptional regulator
MDDISDAHKVLYLLANGWEDLSEIRDFLDLSEKELKEIVDELSLQGVITTHTVH